MHFSKEDSQYLIEEPIFGGILKTALISFGVIEIPAGTVMTYHKSRPLLLFQLLQDVPLESIKDVSLLPYEEGSLVFIEGLTYIPALRFSLCTLPSDTEMLLYNRASTV